MSNQPDGPPPPKPDITQIFHTFGMQTLMACGKMVNPVTQKYETDTNLAQFHIGVLEVLQSKTQGNLSDEEQRILGEILHQARIAYLSIAECETVASDIEFAKPESDNKPES